MSPVDLPTFPPLGFDGIPSGNWELSDDGTEWVPADEETAAKWKRIDGKPWPPVRRLVTLT